MDYTQQYKSIFVNRTSELANIFRINAMNNKRSRIGNVERQDYSFPVVAMTYGAGKTAIAMNYLPNLEKWSKFLKNGDSGSVSVSDEVKNALESLEPYHEQLKEMFSDDEDSSVLEIGVDSEDGYSGTLFKILRRLSDNITFQSDTYPQQLNIAIQQVRKKRAIYIYIDEIGDLHQNDLQKLKTFFGNIHIDMARSKLKLKPMHVFFCGRLARDQSLHLLESPNRPSPFNFRSLTLEPLEACHVQEIRESIDYSFSQEEELNTILDKEVVRLTAGIPRHIWRIIGACHVKKLKFCDEKMARETLYNLCEELVKVFPTDLVVVGDEAMLKDYVTMFFYSTHGITTTNTSYSRYLPITLKETEIQGVYSIVVTPIFTLGLKDDIKRILMSHFESLPAIDQAKTLENRILTTVLRSLIILQTSKDRKDSPLKLHQLLPFLKDTTVPDQDLPLISIDMKDFLVLNKFSKHTTAEQKYSIITESGIAQVCQVKSGSSSGDVIIHIPGKEGEVNIIEFQAKYNESSPENKKNKCGHVVLQDDCCVKAAYDPNGSRITLHILIATSMTDKFLEMMKPSNLLEMKSGDKFTDGKDTAEHKEVPNGLRLIALSPERAEKWMQSLE